MIKKLLVFVCMVLELVNCNSQKILIRVYYESKCPDSRAFILNQLVPTTQQLQNYFQLELIPFGKARSINQGRNGFQCQHGPSECRGNLMQDCVLSLMADRSDVDKVVYVACEMQTLFGTQGIMQCAQRSNVPLNLVQECVTTGQGVKLQLQSEYGTSLVKPSFVPTVTMNGVFDQQIQDYAQVDLMGTLCSILNYEPENCADHYQK